VKLKCFRGRLCQHQGNVTDLF